jgi:hypothetical protein
MKKLLTEQQMIALLPAPETDVMALREQMRCVCPGGIEDWVVQGWKGGEQRVVVVTVDGRKMAAVWWWRAQNGNLIVNAAGSLVKGENVTEAIVRGIEMKAREIGAGEIIFSTARIGLIKQTQRLGFAVTGVSMCKQVHYDT